MKYLILTFLMFAAISCNAQKANFAAQNKSDRAALNIYTTSVTTTCTNPLGANIAIYVTNPFFGFPQVGSVVYTSKYGGVKFVGDGNWYFSNTYATSYRINSLGVITEIYAC